MKKTISLALALCLLVCVGCYGGEQTANNSSAQGGENFVNSEDALTSEKEYSSVKPSINVTSANVTDNTNTSKKPNKTQSSSSAPISSKNSSSAPISSQNSSVVTGLYSVSDILSDYFEAGKNKTYTIEDFYWVIPGKTTVRQLLDKCPPKDYMAKSGPWPVHTLLYYTDDGEIIEVVVWDIFNPDKSTVFYIHCGSTVIE